MYPQPYYQPPQSVVVIRNNPATASMVLGIMGLVVCWIPIVGIVAWLLASSVLVCSYFAHRMPEVGKGARIAGIIASVIGLLVCICYAAVFL